MPRLLLCSVHQNPRHAQSRVQDVQQSLPYVVSVQMVPRIWEESMCSVSATMVRYKGLT